MLKLESFLLENATDLAQKIGGAFACASSMAGFILTSLKQAPNVMSFKAIKKVEHYHDISLY